MAGESNITGPPCSKGSRLDEEPLSLVLLMDGMLSMRGWRTALCFGRASARPLEEEGVEEEEEMEEVEEEVEKGEEEEVEKGEEEEEKEVEEEVEKKVEEEEEEKGEEEEVEVVDCDSLT